MTKEELEKIVNDNKVSSLCSFSGDPLTDLLKEIYFEGYCEGYNHAAGLLQNLGPRIFGCRMDDFLEKNKNRIRERMSAIIKYNAELLSDGK